MATAMWKAAGNAEYDASSPAVQAHLHAVRAEDAFRSENVRVSASSCGCFPHGLLRLKQPYADCQRFLGDLHCGCGCGKVRGSGEARATGQR